MTKALLFALFFASGSAALISQTQDWQPSPGHTQIPIWPRAAPDAVPVAGPEYTKTVGEEPPGAVVVGKVSRPTMTVYSPKGKNSGVAVVVFPGGGYWVLYMDLEGSEVCDWLTSKGITWRKIILMNARPQVREILIAKKMKHWWVVAKCRLIDPTCPTWRARKNYQRLCARYPSIMQRLGLNEFSAF